MPTTSWWAFTSQLPGHSFVKRETASQAANDSTITGTTVSGPYNSRTKAVNATHSPPGGAKKKQQGVSGAYIVSIARTWLGVPYLYGGTTRQGVDCSGLVQNVAFTAGITSCPRTSEMQWAWVQRITAKQAGAGDLIFFVGAELDPPPGHVSIIVHPGLVISADTTGTNVRYDRYDLNGSGVAQVIGFGRMPGASFSQTANQNLAQQAQQNATPGGAIAAVSGGLTGSAVATGFVILILALLFAALIFIALWFKG